MAGDFRVGWFVAKQKLQQRALSTVVVDDGGENDCSVCCSVDNIWASCWAASVKTTFLKDDF